MNFLQIQVELLFGVLSGGGFRLSTWDRARRETWDENTERAMQQDKKSINTWCTSKKADPTMLACEKELLAIVYFCIY